MYIKETFIKDIEELLPQNFTSLHDFGYTGFINETGNCTQTISFGYTEYFPHTAEFVGISAHVDFKDYEAILENAQKELNIPITKRNTIRMSIAHCTIDAHKSVIKKVSSSKDFDSIKADFNKIVLGPTREFFNENSTIDKISKKLEPLQPKDVVQFIQGAPLFSRTILILKLGKSPLYEEKCKEYRDVLLNQVDKTKKESYRNELKLFNYLFA